MAQRVADAVVACRGRQCDSIDGATQCKPRTPTQSLRGLRTGGCVGLTAGSSLMSHVLTRHNAVRGRECEVD